MAPFGALRTAATRGTRARWEGQDDRKCEVLIAQIERSFPPRVVPTPQGQGSLAARRLGVSTAAGSEQRHCNENTPDEEPWIPEIRMPLQRAVIRCHRCTDDTRLDQQACDCQNEPIHDQYSRGDPRQLDYGRRYITRTNQVQRSFEDTLLKQRAVELVRRHEPRRVAGR